MRADLHKMQAEALSKEAEGRAWRRAWLLALLPTGAVVAGILVDLFVTR